MKRFFVEIEFKTDIVNIYWIPIFLVAENNEGATEITERIITAFNEYYEIILISEPMLYSEEVNKEFIDNYVNHRMEGRIAALELNVWQINTVENNPDISFNEGLKMINLKVLMNKDNKQVAKTLSRHKFAVRVIHKNQDLDDFDEFLLVNVVG